MHPATADVLRYFKYDHLPEGALRDTSRLFFELAVELAEELPSVAETTVCLRKLLEAKDCAVRAALDL
jgi:hypothetical protein